MALRIDWVEGRVRLSGDFRSEHVHQVKAELDRCQSPVALDLEEVGLVDVEAIRFLNSCEGAGGSEITRIERPPRGREECPVQLSRLLGAPPVIIGLGRKLLSRAAELGE